MFDDIEQITFRTGLDGGVDASVDVAQDAEIADLDADMLVPDTDLDAQVDISEDVVEDVVDDVVVVTGCALEGCLVNEYCDSTTNKCATSGLCATESCPRGQVCDYRGQCADCVTDLDCGAAATCSAGVCRCSGTQNYCANPSLRVDECVEATSVEACGNDCTACPMPPEFGTAVCNPTGCGFECNASYVKRDGACVQAGIYCANPGGSIGGACDLVAQTGCGAGLSCTVRAISMSSFERVCSPPSALPAALEGESCTGASGKVCEVSHACVQGVCKRYCDMANAAGCRDTQYCAPALAPTPGLGFCNDDCSLTD